MNYYPVFGYLLGMAVIYLAVSTPLFRLADTPPNPNRNRIRTLDGLRGFLALAVFFHHSAYYYMLAASGTWTLGSPFYFQLGGTGVAVFFMITAYLFWTRMLKAGGRMNFPEFYIGRVFRIGPLYLLTVLSMMSIVLAHTGLHLQVTISQFAREICTWLALGFAWEWPHINGYLHTRLTLFGVVWTLHYEWLFYLALPILAPLARVKSLHAPIIAITWIICLVILMISLGKFDNTNMIRSYVIAFFLTGMLCGSLEQIGRLPKLPNLLSSAIISLLIYIDFSHFHTAYHPASVFLLGVCFYLIISGSSFFGLLLLKTSRRLGDISFSIYLMQGLVVNVMFSVPPLRHFALASPFQYWAVIAMCGLILVTLATITHAAIERTGIDLGKVVIRRLARKSYSKERWAPRESGP